MRQNEQQRKWGKQRLNLQFRNKKAPLLAGHILLGKTCCWVKPCYIFSWAELVTARETQNAQQADEQVIQGHIQANGGADVVGFAAMNNVAGFPQDGTR